MQFLFQDRSLAAANSEYMI